MGQLPFVCPWMEAILQAHDDAQEASPLLVHGQLLSTRVLALLVMGNYSSWRMITHHGGYTFVCPWTITQHDYRLLCDSWIAD
jgi:uncharacterized membrane protein YgdD (TMEM256/DUF423 family)